MTAIHKQKTVVLGIDPGSRFLGYGLVYCEPATNDWKHLTSGVINLTSEEGLSRRLSKLALQLEEVLAQFNPQLAVVEKVFLGKNVASAFTLGHARGVVFSQLGHRQIPVHEYATREVKKGIAGHGAADKKQIQQFLQHQLQVTHFVRDDASDALALALYGARVWQRQNLFRERGLEI